MIIGRAISGDVILRCSPVESGWETPLTLSIVSERLAGLDDFELLQMGSGALNSGEFDLRSVIIKGIPWKRGQRRALDVS